MDILFIKFAQICMMIGLATSLSPSQASVHDALNADRAQAGLASLPVQANVQHKAQAWAEQLAREDRLHHSTLTDNINTNRWCVLGENVGYGPTSLGAQNIEVAYMNSPKHRDNILRGDWTGVGVGYATTADGSRIYTVQVFIKDTC